MATYALASAIMAAAAAFTLAAGMPMPNASLRAWNGASPKPGSKASLRISSGVLAATSSISMPPAADAMKTGLPCTRSSTMPEVQLALDGQRLFHQQPLHDAAFGAGLVRHQLHAQHLARDLGGFGGVLGDLDAAALAAAAGVDLRLHHHAAADLLGRGLGLVHGERHLAARHRNVVLAQNGLGLILVNFHGNLLC